MSFHTETPESDAIQVNLDHLSKGVDRILDRWKSDECPTKLTLLNDLANAISPGANWGALKAKSSRHHQQPSQVLDRSLVPPVDRSAEQRSARIAEVSIANNSIELAWLAEETRPLFSMRHSGDPIIGLELSVTEGNGHSEAAIYANLVLNRNGNVEVTDAYPSDLDPVAAQLIYGAIRNLNAVDLYPTLAQSDCNVLRILVGPFDCIVSVPETFRGASVGNFESQGLRILLDEGATPSAVDVESALQLASATIPSLGLKQFKGLKNVQFKLSQPLFSVWEAIKFTAPDQLGNRPVFWLPEKQAWKQMDDFIVENNIRAEGKLGEALDLALALVDIDEPDVYLNASVATSEVGNWSCEVYNEFEILRLREGEPPKVLRLKGEAKQRFERGLKGWAIHEGHNVFDDQTKIVTNVLIKRDLRRASQHLPQVEAIMNGIDPTDKDLLRRVREGKAG